MNWCCRKSAMAKSCLVFFLSAAVGISWAQAAMPLAAANPESPILVNIRQVQDGKDWKNPYLVVRRDGVGDTLE